jgi:hypothetical protein
MPSSGMLRHVGVVKTYVSVSMIHVLVTANVIPTSLIFHREDGGEISSESSI